MTDAMEYKGYTGPVRYTDEDEVLHGKLQGIAIWLHMKVRMWQA